MTMLGSALKHAVQRIMKSDIQQSHHLVQAWPTRVSGAACGSLVSCVSYVHLEFCVCVVCVCMFANAFGVDAT